MGTRGEEGTLEVKYSACVLKLPNQGPVTISFDPVTHLPIIQAFKSTNMTALILFIVGCVTDEKNQNLSYLQKILLQWHFKLGHCGFTTIKWLGQSGLFGALGIKMSKDGVKIPKCAACQLGKRERTPKGGSTIKKSHDGILKKEKTETWRINIFGPV